MTRTRDDSWKRCIGPWDRLEWARLRKFPTARAAAYAFDVKEGTYKAYERAPDATKHIPLDHQKAMAFARKLGVRWEWLLDGKGEPWRSSDELQDRLIAAFEEVDPAMRAEAVEVAERMFRAMTGRRNG